MQPQERRRRRSRGHEEPEYLLERWVLLSAYGVPKKSQVRIDTFVVFCVGSMPAGKLFPSRPMTIEEEGVANGY
jgi:hypothetical protein